MNDPANYSGQCQHCHAIYEGTKAECKARRCKECAGAANLPDKLPPLPPVPEGFDRWVYRGTEWRERRIAVYATVNTAISADATAENWSLQTARPMGARWLHYIEAVRDAEQPPHPGAPLESLEGLENLRFYESKAFSKSFKVGDGQPQPTGVEASKWQSIETAPRDGTEILLASSRIEIGSWDDDKYSKTPRPYWKRFSVFGKTYERQNAPTHWMPLPPPPKP